MSYDLGTAHGQIILSYDSDRDVDRAERDIDKLDRKAKTTGLDFKKFGKILGDVGGIIGKGAKFAGITVALIEASAAAASLGIQILGIVPNLVSILSLSAALPGIFVGMAAAAGVLKAVFAGIGPALKAAFDPTKAAAFDKAIKNLSPSAQAFAKSVQANAKGLKDLGKGLQEAFFQTSHLSSSFGRAVGILKTMSPQLRGVAADFGEITRQVVNFALSGDSVTFVNKAIGEFRNALADVTPSIVPILAGLRAVGTVGLSLIPKLSGAVGILAIQFADWLQGIAADGRLQTWINTALQTLKSLGSVIANVFSIFNSVVTAANSVGGGLLNTLALITGQFADFLKSAAGGQAMRDLFASILAVAKQLSPAITTLVGALATALAPAIATIAEDLGPILLQTVNALVPAFKPLASALAAVLVAIAPLVPPLAQLVALLAQGLSSALLAIVNELGPLISLFAQGLTKALTGIAPLFDVLNENLPLTAKLGAEMAASFAKLMPTLIELGNAIMSALVPVLPQLTAAAATLAPKLAELAAVVANNLNTALQILIPFIPGLVQAFVNLFVALSKIEGAALTVITTVLKIVGAFFALTSAIVSFLQAVPGALSAAFAFISNLISTFASGVVAFFTALPARIGAVVAAIPGVLLGAFEAMIAEGAATLGFGIGLLVGLFTRFPFTAAAAIGNLAGLIGGKIREAWNAAVSATVSGVSAAVSAAFRLPGRTVSAIASLAGLIASIARSAWSGLVSRFNSGISNAASSAGTLPRRIKGALGNLGSLLVSSGQSLISGLINGIQSGIGRVLGMVSSLASRVKSAFNSALSIFSPSKVFFESGVNIDEGLIGGLQHKLGDVVQMAKKLAASVIAPTWKLGNSVAPTIVDAVAAAPGVKAGTVDRTGAGALTFGPYHLEVDGQVIASLAIDAVTGAPVVVSDAADEGARQKAWAGSGRRGRNGS